MIRYLTIKLITPLAWKLLPSLKVKALKKFSLIEMDSGYQLLSSMDFIKDQRYRKHFFAQSIEEFQHGQMFKKLAESYSISVKEPQLTRENILTSDSKRSVIDFYTYLYVGEKYINQQFKWYTSKYLGKSLIKVFRNIAEDEQSHENDSYQILEEISSQQNISIKKVLLIARAKYFYNQSKQSFQFLTVGILFILLLSVYFILGPLTILIVNRSKLLDGKEK